MSSPEITLKGSQITLFTTIFIEIFVFQNSYFVELEILRLRRAEPHTETIYCRMFLNCAGLLTKSAILDRFAFKTMKNKQI
jgi:hypothetical protein